MTGKTILPILIENAMAIDIDDMSSFEKAEILMKTLDCIRP